MSDQKDAFQLNIDGVSQLIDSGLNKNTSSPNGTEGIASDYHDEFELNLSDEELRNLAIKWENNNASYDQKILERSRKNKMYYLGLQKQATTQDNTPVASNILFEAEETFIPQAIAKNPEPVVFSDNTPEGKAESNALKSMLQFHATELNFKRKLSVMVRDWSVYFTGVVKYGWNSKLGDKGDITVEIRKPENFILDKDGYIDEFGVFRGKYLGERIKTTAGDLIERFPKKKAFIYAKVGGKLGTELVYTEWWTDEFTFSTYEDEILDKHKNQFYNYDKVEKSYDEFGLETKIETKGENHFAAPMMPYTFLSVFSFQEQPHDVTTLIEQNIKNQERISKRDEQIDRNLASNNNSILVNNKSFDQETAGQAAQALQDGDPILVDDLEKAIKRIPANNLPGGIIEAQDKAKDALRGVFGVQGLTAQQPTNNTTAHGMVLNQEYDATRIGGGIGDAIEATARNMFNWLTQLYYVFYDEEHFAAVMGSGQAVEYVSLKLANSTRKFVVTVAANSMAPKDELSEMQNALNLATNGWLDPITLFQRLNDPDPLNTAKKVVLWKLDPSLYFQQFFPQEAAMQQQNAMMQMTGQSPPLANPGEPDLTANLAAPNDLSAKTELGRQAPLPPTAS